MKNGDKINKDSIVSNLRSVIEWEIDKPEVKKTKKNIHIMKNETIHYTYYFLFGVTRNFEEKSKNEIKCKLKTGVSFSL